MSITQRPPSARDSRQLLADPAMTAHSPGEEFAQAASLDGGGENFSVRFRGYLPTAFPLFAERPRYTVRQLLNMATVRDDEKATPFVGEAAGECGTASGTSYESTLEAGFDPALLSADHTELSVSLRVPTGLLAHPRLLSSFIDRRLLVRVGVRENHTLLHGSADGVIAGLLRLPELRRLDVGGGELVSSVTAAAAHVEETGGSCDGVVAHPSLYWQMVDSGLLDSLGAAGIRVARTRMMPPHQLLLGDFRAAATLLDPADSSLSLHRGAAPDGGDLIEARCRIALAVHLPQHFVLVGTEEAA